MEFLERLRLHRKYIIHSNTIQTFTLHLNRERFHRKLFDLDCILLIHERTHNKYVWKSQSFRRLSIRIVVYTSIHLLRFFSLTRESLLRSSKLK